MDEQETTRGSGRFSLDWSDTNTALAALVIGSVLGLVAIRRGFRGFALAT